MMALLLAAEAAAAPICTDRPTKANATCTVPAGQFQLEANAFGWSLTEAADARTELMSAGSSTLKIGLTARSDLQIAFTPYLQQTVKQSGESDRLSGFGDMVLRYKHRLTVDAAPVQVAVIPFVKLPTAAAGLGNDRVEGGLAIPVSFALAGPVTMTLGPEADLLADGDGRGRHPAIVNLVNVAAPLAPRLTLVGEFWTNFNFDPSGTVKQASADVAVTYLASAGLQLDAGANAGLTRQTADIELYAGMSVRF
jgi:hypothetical protein